MIIRFPDQHKFLLQIHAIVAENYDFKYIFCNQNITNFLATI